MLHCGVLQRQSRRLQTSNEQRHCRSSLCWRQTAASLRNLRCCLQDTSTGPACWLVTCICQAIPCKGYAPTAFDVDVPQVNDLLAMHAGITCAAGPLGLRAPARSRSRCCSGSSLAQPPRCRAAAPRAFYLTQCQPDIGWKYASQGLCVVELSVVLARAPSRSPWKLARKVT